MHVTASILRQALDLYLQTAYPQGAPLDLQNRLAPLRDLPPDAVVPMTLFEQSVPNSAASFALRLGQPLYPHMKLVIDPCPASSQSTATAASCEPTAVVSSPNCRGYDFLLRADAHDQHLHAPPNSPDAAWLASLRQSNKALTEKIESLWSAAGLPTFKDYLRSQLAARRHAPT